MMASYKVASALEPGDVWIERKKPRNHPMCVVHVAKHALAGQVSVIADDLSTNPRERWVFAFFRVNRIEMMDPLDRPGSR
jgi:hypothetical protein